MARMKEGVTVWQCSCGAVIAMGRLCGCGKCYADILRERHRVIHDGDARREKNKKPASSGEFTESYLFRSKKK